MCIRDSTNSVTQDGFASGRLVGVDVGEDGTIFGRYSNGQSKACLLYTSRCV